MRLLRRRYADERTETYGQQPRFQGGTALDITATEDGGLLLQKHRATCNICGGTYEVVNFKGFDICRECFLGIREEVERVHG